MNGGGWVCGFCDTFVEIPHGVCMALLGSMPAHAVAAVQAEQQRHYADCEPYIARASANGIAAIEAALQEASHG